jgi:PAS domain S-box-containing protein
LAASQGIIMTDENFKHKLAEPIQAETALQSNGDQFYEIPDNFIQIIFKADLKQTIEYISPMIETAIGYNPSDIIGKNFNNFVLLSDLPKTDEVFHVVISEVKTKLLETTVKSKEGKKIVIEIILIPKCDNQKVVSVQGMARVT